MSISIFEVSPFQSSEDRFIYCLDDKDKNTNYFSATTLKRVTLPEDSKFSKVEGCLNLKNPEGIPGIVFNPNPKLVWSPIQIKVPQSVSIEPGTDILPENVLEDHLQERMKLLEQKVELLEKSLTAYLLREYNLYSKFKDISCPTEFTVKDKRLGLTPYSDIQDKSLDRMELNPLFQPFFGSPRSVNRVLTYYDKDEPYLVKAQYDAVKDHIIKHD